MRGKFFTVVILVLVVALLPLACSPTQQYELSTSVSPSGSGTVSPSSGTYDAGTEVTLTANPTSSYVFDHWSGDTTSTYNPVTIVMDSEKSVTAHFKAHLEDGIIFQDNFDDNRNDWKDASVEDGALHVIVSADEGHRSTQMKHKWPPAAPYYPDFGYEVEIIPIEADERWGRGIIFLSDGKDNVEERFVYGFLISGDGYYMLFTENVYSRESNLIIDWTKSGYINEGNVSNMLKVICRDSIIELYVNGHLLESLSGEFPDDIGDNGIGLIVVASSGNAHIAFDNMKMWAITPS